MKIDSDSFRTIIIGWVVIVTIFLAILLPYAINIPTLPALFYKIVSGPSSPVLPEYPYQIESKNPEGLLVWYTFDDPPRNYNWFTDQSGNGIPAYVKGLFIGNAPGIVGNSSISLSGLGYLYNAINPLSGRTNMTIAFWFTLEDRSHDYRLASAVSTREPRSGWIIGSHSSELWDDSGDPIRISSRSSRTGSASFQTWNHKALVYDGHYVTEYLNGLVISNYTASGEPVGTGGAMLIGSWQPFGQNYAGRIDDFRIYDRALGPEEVAGLYAMAAVPESPTPTNAGLSGISVIAGITAAAIPVFLRIRKR
jgi:hypothetical protein